MEKPIIVTEEKNESKLRASASARKVGGLFKVACPLHTLRSVIKKVDKSATALLSVILPLLLGD